MKFLSLCIVTVMMVFAIGLHGSASTPAATSADEPATCPASVAEEAKLAPVANDVVAAGGSCGGNTCGKNQHCCNASCGWCVPIGVECPQIACAAGQPDPDEIGL
jgi:hypothetical protein